MYTNTRIRIHLPCIYLLKVNNGNSRTRHVICTKLTKKDTRTTWHEDIKKHWHSSGVSIINFEKVPHLYLVFHSWISGNVAGWVYQQKLKYIQVKIIKHARTDASYAILTKCVNLQHEKKPKWNLLSMQSVGFEQTWN